MPPPALVDGLRDGARRRARARCSSPAAPSATRALGPALAGFAERAAIPLLADPLSGARRGRPPIAHYDALLRDPEWAAAHAPELVLRVGDLPTSKPLRHWLHGARRRARSSRFDPEGAWQDPAGAVATILAADPRPTLDAIAAHRKPGPTARGSTAGTAPTAPPPRRSRARSRPPA